MVPRIIAFKGDVNRIQKEKPKIKRTAPSQWSYLRCLLDLHGIDTGADPKCQICSDLNIRFRATDKLRV